ncbi:Fic family protein [Nonomuraea fuscirosea]|uniref:Fic family protein n=1 Tax=Nonomuraea fuscirosea TaxID=1291556 RepID=UPI003788CE2E
MTPVWDIDPHPEATDREGPGNFREHDIHPFAEGMTPPSWTLVAGEIQGWADVVCELGRKLEAKDDIGHPLPEELAKIHNSFERIHPFIDGNGRTGRLVLNLILVRLGYPPIIVFKRQRESYLTALRRADAGDCGALGELIARAMEDNLNRFIVPNVAGPARLVPLAALVDEEFSIHALRQAAQRGRLNAVQGPGWRVEIFPQVGRCVPGVSAQTQQAAESQLRRRLPKRAVGSLSRVLNWRQRHSAESRPVRCGADSFSL